MMIRTTNFTEFDVCVCWGGSTRFKWSKPAAPNCLVDVTKWYDLQYSNDITGPGNITAPPPNQPTTQAARYPTDRALFEKYFWTKFKLILN